MPSKNKTEISFTSEIRVRFAETDPLGIVWHGNYIQYFEDGREAFGRHHGIAYLDHKAAGYTTDQSQKLGLKRKIIFFVL